MSGEYSIVSSDGQSNLGRRSTLKAAEDLRKTLQKGRADKLRIVGPDGRDVPLFVQPAAASIQGGRDVQPRQR